MHSSPTKKPKMTMMGEMWIFIWDGGLWGCFGQHLLLGTASEASQKESFSHARAPEQACWSLQCGPQTLDQEQSWQLSPNRTEPWNCHVDGPCGMLTILQIKVKPLLERQLRRNKCQEPLYFWHIRHWEMQECVNKGPLDSKICLCVMRNMSRGKLR